MRWKALCGKVCCSKEHLDVVLSVSQTDRQADKGDKGLGIGTGHEDTGEVETTMRKGQL